MSMRCRSYSELRGIRSLQERYEYLRLDGSVGDTTFGFDRYLNQRFYRSPEWKSARNQVLIRDEGWDLGIDGYPVGYRPTVHHMNPVTLEQLDVGDPDLFNPEFLILCSSDTHNAIHYGPKRLIKPELIERAPFDTCPWKIQNGRRDDYGGSDF